MGLGEGWGAVIQGGLSFLGGERANAQGVDAMRENIAFQREMSNSAHQREVRDLKKAGLNPILSANQGASAPSGTSAPKFENSIGSAVTSAMDAKRLANDTKLMGSQMALQAAQGAQSIATAKREGATAKQAEVQTAALQAQMDAIIKKAGFDAKQYDIDTKFQQFDNYLRRVTNGLEAGATAKDMMSPLGGLMKNFGKKTIKLPSGKDSAFEKHNGDLYRKSDGLIINQP